MLSWQVLGWSAEDSMRCFPKCFGAETSSPRSNQGGGDDSGAAYYLARKYCKVECFVIIPPLKKKRRHPGEAKVVMRALAVLRRIASGLRFYSLFFP